MAYNTEGVFLAQDVWLDYAHVRVARAGPGAARRPECPRVIVHGHRPMYCPTTETAVVLDYNGEGDYVRRRRRTRNGGEEEETQPQGLCKWEQESSRLGVLSVCANADGTNCARFESVSYLEASPEERELSDPASVPTEELFHAHGVDVVFYGHEHEYWRSFPVFNETVVNGTGYTTFETYREPRGTVHVVTGAAGTITWTSGTSRLAEVLI